MKRPEEGKEWWYREYRVKMRLAIGEVGELITERQREKKT